MSHIKNHLPQSRLTWLVEPKWSSLVTIHPQIDKVLVFNRPRNILAVWELYRDFAREQFDIALDLQRHFKSGFFSLLSGAKRRIGFHRQNAKEFNWLFNKEHIDYVNKELELPKWRHYLKFTEYLGFPEPSVLDFGISSIEKSVGLPGVIAQIDEPFIAVVMGSSWESKDWFFESYLRLVKDILDAERIPVVLLGDHSKKKEATRLRDEIGPGKLINLVGKTSLLEVVAVLKAAAAGVGPDSGPGHISAAVGTPYVTLFGPTSPTRAAPYKCEHLVVQSEIDCISCYRKHCPDLDRQCMRLLTVEKVKAKLSKALAMSGRR
ncbi:MAG: glycosyltransferase family 9 protein [Deltaproteobacteria bacterium]|nr:MAG: glycosyltransferase family 9 protein [Deltaproteobacteria bacterium]